MSILLSKLFLISAGVVSLAMGFKFYFPFTVHEIPVVWSIFMSWLKPPYMYVIINAIIVIIIVSSRFHWSPSEPSVRSEHLISVKTPPPSYYESLPAQPEIASLVEESMAAADAAVAVHESENMAVEVKPTLVDGSNVVFGTEEATAEAKDVYVDSMPMYDTPPQEIVSPEPQLEFLLPVTEKPLLSSRFGHRKPIRTPEGVRALKVAKPKRQETLESSWKMITEGRHVPLARHSKKSEAWEHSVSSTPTALDLVAASESFQDRTSNYSAAAVSRIRKEPSLGQDELNRRVEAFIKKFNEDMRMQSCRDKNH